MNRIWITATVALMVLTGCAAAPPSQDHADNNSTAHSVVESTCKDSTNIGTQSVDLQQVRLHSDESELLVEYTLSDALPAKADVLLYIMARSPNNETRYQLGTEFKDGTQSAQFVYDVTSSTQKKISPEAVVTNRTVTAHFPLGDLDGLGTGFEWDARVSVDGAGVDRCPAGETATWNVHAD